MGTTIEQFKYFIESLHISICFVNIVKVQPNRQGIATYVPTNKGNTNVSCNNGGTTSSQTSPLHKLHNYIHVVW